MGIIMKAAVPAHMRKRRLRYRHYQLSDIAATPAHRGAPRSPSVLEAVGSGPGYAAAGHDASQLVWFTGMIGA